MKLSIAMIVKNEQKNLERCLRSIMGLGAQLIVVDTGSVDQTVKIAKDFGAEVYYHPWENNFAKHRNQSFSYDTGDWVLQLDADEELVFFDKPYALLNALQAVRKNINAISLHCEDMEAGKISARTLLVRLFRRGKVKYKRAIHNEPMYKGPTGMMPEYIVKLRHYGYDLQPHEKKVKAERTIKLLKEELRKNPHDYDSMFYISQAYGNFEENMDEGVKWAIRYAEKRKKIKKIRFHKSVYWSIIAYYLKGHDLKEAWKWLEVALKDIPGDLDINMALIKYGILTKNQNLVGAGARAYVNAYHDFSKNRAEIGSQFVFNKSEAHYAFALFHLATTYLEHSKNTLEMLYKSMDKIAPSYAKDFQEGLKTWFDKNESVFKHNNAMLSATETARALYSVRPKPDREGLPAHLHSG